MLDFTEAPTVDKSDLLVLVDEEKPAIVKKKTKGRNMDEDKTIEARVADKIEEAPKNQGGNFELPMDDDYEDEYQDDFI